MKARRKDMGRKRKRRRRSRLSGILYGLLLTAAVAAALTLSVTVFFKITDVQVSGETRYAAEELIRTAGVSSGDNLFMINKYSMAGRLIEEYPYLDSVRIKRRLPGTLEIIVTDCVPRISVTDGEDCWLADEGGKLLEKVKGDSPLRQGTIAVSGCSMETAEVGKNLSEVDEKRAKPLLEILHMAKNDDILISIRSIELEKLYQITIAYGDRLKVRLGDTEEMEKKFRFFAYVLSQLTEADRGMIDVSDVKEARFIPE